MYDYEIKITGVDNNKTKSVWFSFNNNIDNRICTNIIDNFIRIKKENINLDIKKENIDLDIKRENIDLDIKKENIDLDIKRENIDLDIEKEKIDLDIKNKIINNEIFIIEDNYNINKINYIIDILEKYKNEFKIKKLCISGNENFLNIIKEKYNIKLLNLFKYIDYIEINSLFNLKKEYDINGKLNYNINNNIKKHKIFDYNLVIIDETIIENNIYYNYLKENLCNTLVCIILRNIYQNYNKLNNDINIIKIYNKNNNINNLLINEINNIEKYNNINFIEKIKKVLLNNTNINIKNNLNEFNNSYYINNENNIMIDINKKYIKKKLKKDDEIIYKINNKYNLDKIKIINKKKKELDIISYKDLIDINKNKKIKLSKLKKKYNRKINYYQEIDNEYISQEYLNYIIENIGIENNLKNIFRLINNINNINSYVIKTYNNLNINLLNNKEKEVFIKKLEEINVEIYKLYEILNKKKNNKSYIKYIIIGLREIINIYIKDIFIEVYEKDYFISNYDYSKNDYKIINKLLTFNINDMYINISNILNNNNINNVSKLIFIYNCLNIHSKNKIVYIKDKKII